jgi:hypothetical protein
MFFFNITVQIRFEVGKTTLKTTLWLAALAKKKGMWFSFCERSESQIYVL